MNSDKLGKFWLVITGAIVLLIITSSLIIWFHRDKGQAIEISPPATSKFQGNIFIEGAVGNPGRYPLKADDSLDVILQSSGGIDENADTAQMYLYIPHQKQATPPQKIDINRAEAWLLQALPAIGEVKAQAICDYRHKNGPFDTIEEITKVPGIDNSTFEKIKGLITVAEYR